MIFPRLFLSCLDLLVIKNAGSLQFGFGQLEGFNLHSVIGPKGRHSFNVCMVFRPVRSS